MIPLINIVSDYKLVHYDDFPILFFGKNILKKWVVGSFIYENEEQNNLQYFHSIVNQEQLKQFLNQTITYLDLLRNAEKIVFVSKNYAYKILDTKVIEFDDIDKSFLPLKNSFCPVHFEISEIFNKEDNYLSKVSIKPISFSNRNNIKRYKSLNIEYFSEIEFNSQYHV